VIYEDGKSTVTSSVESLMSDHFSQVASIYSQYRTFDHEAINYITKKLAFKQTIVAADIGCGDGRYSLKLIEKLFTFLATVGSTAPFIGLFGTVWGIMNSFQSIAISRNTSLAIVAPGIAEALFATALGLLAAIPAVMAYNKFNNESRIYGRRIENFTKRFLSII